MKRSGEILSAAFNALFIISVFLPNIEHKLISFKRKAFEGDAKFRRNLTKYEKGDRVFHLLGTDHVIVLPQKRDSYVECAVCQKMNPKDRECCGECQHTLVKGAE